MSQSILNYELELPSDFDEYEWEVEAKGWFDDVILYFEGRKYSLNFYDPSRLNQEVEDGINSRTFFFEQNLIIISSVTSKNMHAAIEELINTNQVGMLLNKK